MKKVGIMQPYLFPYIGYFQSLHAVDDYVIYDDVNYIKGGWINRNNILIGAQPIRFSVALSDASPNKLINEIDIQDDFIKFRKTLTMAYAKAPHYVTVMALINEICDSPDKRLARFIGSSIQRIAEYLELSTNIMYSSDLHKDVQLKGQAKVLAICEELGADMYINAIGGRELYDTQSFAKLSIELKFIKTGDIEYRQYGKPFVPWLSIIDVMMFNSPPEIRKMLDIYELV